MGGLALSNITIREGTWDRAELQGSPAVEDYYFEDREYDVGILLPTYCEEGNIGRLICEIENLGLNSCILVVDDSSPDDTSNIVREAQKRFGNILLLNRPKKAGLGTAITDGFRTFLSLEKTPRYIVTMDADYSHDPEYIPLLVSQVENSADFAIGSRYCPGGETQNWGTSRLIISRVANFIASLLIGAEIRDYTSGFRCYSRKVLTNIINDLHSQTYEIQIETIRQTHTRGFKIKELPVTFINRKKGKSKLTFKEIKQFLSHILIIGKSNLTYKRKKRTYQ
ncbi:MAG: polyprenol monophosphomannose synthase [Thermoproteota archaeon]